MSVEENKAVGRRLVEEGFNQGNLDLVDEPIDPSFVHHNPDYGVTPDREGLRQYVTVIRTGFPDVRITAEDEIAEGDKVVVRMTATGAHKGEIMGIPPTGKQIALSSVVLMRLAGGKAVERWAISDRLSMMQQLGILSS